MKFNNMSHKEKRSVIFVSGNLIQRKKAWSFQEEVESKLQQFVPNLLGLDCFLLNALRGIAVIRQIKPVCMSNKGENEALLHNNGITLPCKHF